MNNKLLIISLISLIILLGFIAKNEVYEKMQKANHQAILENKGIANRIF